MGKKAVTAEASTKSLDRAGHAGGKLPAALAHPPESQGAPQPGREPDTASLQALDRALKAQMAKFTAGLSPAGLAGAYLDWLAHLATSPGKQVNLSEKAVRKWQRLFIYAIQNAVTNRNAPCIEPLPQDRRFRGEAWQKWPYNLVYQSFLLNQQWWHNATTGVRGVTKQHEDVMEFASRQILDVFSPSNFLWTNPEVLAKTREEAGANLIRGWQAWLEDLDRWQNHKPPVGAENFRPGHEVAVTPGKVVFRNHLIELIQYTPTTETVRPEPILFVPAWIMKYYILDLSPHNSMVRFLVDQGYTVFMISWRNPDARDRDLGMDDYRKMGVLDAISAVQGIVPDRKIHGVGYCLGGTLLSITAAALERDGQTPFETLTFFASQIDFTEPGELQLFINESQVTFLEDMMWEQGYLDSSQMSGAFQMLRSVDLIWSRIVHRYLMGDPPAMFDLMAWNADGTRMPFRMHSEYLRALYLNNDLTEGRFAVDGRPISVADIRVPVFSVGTVKDHVAPWRSVYKMHLYLDTDLTFVLTTGGHNTGIVSEPGHKNRSFQIATAHRGARYIDPENWMKQVPEKDGSWWPEWVSWLDEKSGDPVPPPPMGAALADAPGTYVLQK
ncbi:poly-beta-hydroxybutyrate polymerase [Ruegeria lacuscaerulensis ITI-1157]|nr:poly-beta-hydroxybutyrate polymerase [Ruegeria lacuscaerulensis ITI-1157]SHK12441.1 polyhydroxyalkanoate synthase [Ruegeria lacuscaerulensis ITI-1157]